MIDELRSDLSPQVFEDAVKSIKTQIEDKDFHPEQMGEYLGGGSLGLIDLLIDLLKETWHYVNSEVK